MNSLSKDSRILLCRPHGGLNDSLNQIERCWNYADERNRRLVVDFSKNQFIGEVFRLIKTRTTNERVTFEPSSDFLKDLDRATVFPAELAGRLNSYGVKTKRNRNRSVLFDAESGARLGFDFNSDYSEQLLVHHSGGGGTRSQASISKLMLREEARASVQQLLEFLPSTFYSAHVRSTDYQTDYRLFFSRVRRRIGNKQILICTDNARVLEFAGTFFPEGQLLTFSPPEVQPDNPIHRSIESSGAIAMKRAAIQLIAEMQAVSISDAFFFTSVRQSKPRFRQVFSGFSTLLAFLAEERGAGFFPDSDSGSSTPGKSIYLDSASRRIGNRIYLAGRKYRKLVNARARKSK